MFPILFVGHDIKVTFPKLDFKVFGASAGIYDTSPV